MRKSIFTAESQFSWNWVVTAQIGAQAVSELRSGENQFLRTNRNFHEIGCSRPKSAHKPSASSDEEKINFYGRIAIFMKFCAHDPNRRTSGPRAQMIRKSIFSAHTQYSRNWVLTARIDAEIVLELRSWDNQILRPNRNFHEIGCSRPKSAHKPSSSSEHEKINFYGRIATFMKWVVTALISAQAVLELRSWENQFLQPNRNFHEMGAHGPNRRTSRPRAQIMRKSIFTAESQFSWNWVVTAQIGAQAVSELRSGENQFLRTNCNFHEIGCSRPKSAHKPSASSDEEKINFYGRIAIFMKFCAHDPNRRTSGPRAQMIRKSIFSADTQYWRNWVLTSKIDAEIVLELRSWDNQILRPNRNFHEIGWSRPKSAHKPSPSSDHEKNEFLRPNHNFHEIGFSRPNSAQKPSSSSDHEKINFYGRIAIFMKLGAHGPNRRRSAPRAHIIRKSIFTAESQISWNWVLTAQIDPQALPELRSWENQFLPPNLKFHEIGCSRPKSTHERSPSSDHEKINFYGRIAIFMKLGAHVRNRRNSRPRAQIVRKPIFTAKS